MTAHVFGHATPSFLHACEVNARRVGGSRERAPVQRRAAGNPVRIQVPTVQLRWAALYAQSSAFPLWPLMPSVLMYVLVQAWNCRSAQSVHWPLPEVGL